MSEIKQNKKNIKKKVYKTEHHILEIAYIFAQVKKKYKFFKYIDDSYINIKKKKWYISHELREALCNALFRNIILEVYSIFFDDRAEKEGDVLSYYVMKAINSEKPDFLKKYNEKKTLLKKYRCKILAHKSIITKRAENYNYKDTQLDELMRLSEQIFEWFISYSFNNTEISDENRMNIEDYKREPIDYNEDGTTEFFIKQIAGLTPTEITDKKYKLLYR